MAKTKREVTTHGGDRTSAAAKLSAQQKRKRVLELRLGGATFALIAETVGLSSASAARKVFARAMSAISHEAAEEARAVELARLDEMQMRLTLRLRQDDLSVVPGLLRIMELRAKLLGLYTLPAGGTTDTSQIGVMFAAMLQGAEAFAASYTPPPDPTGL